MKIILFITALAVYGCTYHIHQHDAKQSYSHTEDSTSSSGDYETHHARACKNKKHAEICPMCQK